MKTEVYILPTHWASSLINNDDSGMSDNEIDELNKWVDDHKEDGHYFMCINVDFDTFNFGYFNGLMTDVCEFTFDVSAINK